MVLWLVPISSDLTDEQWAIIVYSLTIGPLVTL